MPWLSSTTGCGVITARKLQPLAHPSRGCTERCWPDLRSLVVGGDVILRGHNLPTPPPVPLDPGVGEPVAAPKFTVRSPTADDQPSGYHGRDGAETMDDHRVVVRRHHRIRSGDDRIEHGGPVHRLDRKSTRLNSSHMSISYAV